MMNGDKCEMYGYIFFNWNIYFLTQGDKPFEILRVATTFRLLERFMHKKSFAQKFSFLLISGV